VPCSPSWLKQVVTGALSSSCLYPFYKNISNTKISFVSTMKCSPSHNYYWHDVLHKYSYTSGCTYFMAPHSVACTINNLNHDYCKKWCHKFEYQYKVNNYASRGVISPPSGFHRFNADMTYNHHLWLSYMTVIISIKLKQNVISFG
jgi:hypothetical protein